MGKAARVLTESTLQHEWALMIQMPVEILMDDQGQPVIMVDPDVRLDAEAGGAYGCMRCHLPLAEGLTEMCTPPVEERS